MKLKLPNAEPVEISSVCELGSTGISIGTLSPGKYIIYVMRSNGLNYFYMDMDDVMLLVDFLRREHDNCMNIVKEALMSCESCGDCNSQHFDQDKVSKALEILL